MKRAGTRLDERGSTSWASAEGETYGMDTKSVTGSLVFNLLPATATERIVPYVAGGLDLYRAAF